MFYFVNHPFSLITGSAPGFGGSPVPSAAAPSPSLLPVSAPCDLPSSVAYLASSSVFFSASFFAPDLLLLLDFLDLVDFDVSYLLKFFSMILNKRMI